MIGCAVRASMVRNSASSAVAATNAQIVSALPQPLDEARMNAKTSDAMPAVAVSAPAISSRPGRRSGSRMKMGASSMLLAPIFIREPERRPGRLDIAGALTATAGMASLVFAFIRASSSGWGNALTIWAFVAATALLALFLTIEARTAQPIMPLRLFANRNRASAYLNILLFFATMFGVFFFLTQFLQDVLGFSPIIAGLAFLPMTVPK